MATGLADDTLQKFSKVLEVGCILGIYTFRYLKDTLRLLLFDKRKEWIFKKILKICM
jgi:hypothetical protein